MERAAASSRRLFRFHFSTCGEIFGVLEQNENKKRSAMTSNYQIDYIEFPSTDGLKTRRFFEQAFGWNSVSYGPTYHAIEGAGIDAGIQGDAQEVSTAPLPIVRTTDLEAAQRAVELSGGIVTHPAFDFPGGRRFHFREPGGSEMAVWIAVS
jgi:predicted enzyme related to lactoylglutathione lyase